MKIKGTERTINLEHPTVQNVIEIAEDILSENKVLDIDTLYTIAKRRLKIPRKGLLKIIKFLLHKKILIEGSKYTKETLLANYIRNKIYKFIKNTNGAHFSFIKNSLKSIQSSGQLIWHLEMLLKFKFIKKTKVGNFTIFMPIGTEDKVGILNFFLKDEITEKILICIGLQKEIKRSSIYKVIDEEREHVYYRLNNLIENEICEFLTEDKKCITISDEFNDIISELVSTNEQIFKNLDNLLVD